MTIEGPGPVPVGHCGVAPYDVPPFVVTEAAKVKMSLEVMMSTAQQALGRMTGGPCPDEGAPCHVEVRRDGAHARFGDPDDDARAVVLRVIPIEDLARAPL